MRSVVTVIAVVVVVALVAIAGTFQVQETEYAIVARFGDPRRVIDEAGLHFKWPPPIETLLRIDRRTNVLDPEPGEYLTSDKKNILVSNFLVWSVADPLRYLVSLTDKTSAEARLTDIMRSEVGTTLGAYPLSALVSTEAQDQTMADVMHAITRKTAQRASDSFGVHVAAVRIKRLNFPPQNKQAVFRRMEAERQRIARQYRSEGEEEAEKIRAQADREEAVLLNEARRQAEEIRGEADAEATRIYAEAFGQDPEFFEFVRSLEAYQNIIGESSTIVVPSDAELLKVLQTPTPDGDAHAGAGGCRRGQPAAPERTAGRRGAMTPATTPSAGNGGNRFGLRLRGWYLLPLLFVALIVHMAVTGVWVVQQNEQGVLLRFGRVRSILPAGMHFILPYPLETMRLVRTTEVRTMSVGFGHHEDDPAGPGGRSGRGAVVDRRHQHRRNADGYPVHHQVAGRIPVSRRRLQRRPAARRGAAQGRRKRSDLPGGAHEGRRRAVQRQGAHPGRVARADSGAGR